MTEASSDDLVQLPQVGLTGPGPSDLADLHSLRQDILFARECILAYLQYAERDEAARREAGPAPTALWNAGVISYRRAFNSGKAHLVPKRSRFQLQERALTLLTGERREIHEQLLEQANKHVAHRVAEHEGAVITVFLAPEGEERAVVGVGNLSARFVGPTPEFASGAIDVCQLIAEVLQIGIDQKSDAVIKSLQEAGDLDDLYERAKTPG